MLTKLLVLLLFVIIPAQACAETATALSPDGLLNYSTNLFLSSAQQYIHPIKSAAQRLFWLLLLIAVVLHGIKLILNPKTISSFVAIFTQFVLIAGLYYFLLQNGSEIGASIVDSMISITNTSRIGPSEMLDLTFNLGRALSEHKAGTLTNIPVSIMINAVILIFFIVMFLVTVRYITLYLCSYIFCIIGVFVLGFGALSSTRFIAVNYLRITFSLACELMTMILVCNIGFSILDRILQSLISLDGTITLQECCVVLFTAIFIHALSSGLPRIVGSLFISHPGAGTISFSVPGIPAVFKQSK